MKRKRSNKITYILCNAASIICMPFGLFSDSCSCYTQINQIAGIKYAKSPQSMQYNVVITKQPIITR